VRESNSKILNIQTPEAMRQLGMDIGTALVATTDKPQCVQLEGELGAGKTTLVAGIVAAFGVKGPVRSPTYTLVEPYELDGRFLYHMDLYRLTDPDEIEPLGVRELLVPGAVLLIEWPQRARGRLPPADLSIAIEYGDPPGEGRRVELTCTSQVAAEALARMLW
jgi:tRNA threonylcarbamoyladenosine biosynthesis protein TsaE